MKYRALIKEVMTTDVKTVDLEDSIEEAARVMKENRTGSVIVVGEKNIKGIVTSEDIVYRYVADKIGSKAKDIMSTDLVTISPNKNIEEASKLMVEKKIKRLPVFDGSRLVGVITASDIMRIEPALYEILLERLKIKRPEFAETSKGGQFLECEQCGNYADDVEEIDGVWVCNECEELTKER